MSVRDMDLGHRIFLSGIILLTGGLVIIIGAFATLNLNIIYVGGATSTIGWILVLAGIHIFMRETIREVGHVRREEAPQTEVERRSESLPRMVYPPLSTKWQIYALAAFVILVLLGVLLVLGKL